MLGIQNSLPVTNSVKFKGESPTLESQDYCDFEELPNDEFSKKDIETERDEKLADIEKTQTLLNDFADNLDKLNELNKNPNKTPGKASKAVRFTVALLGLGSSFVSAKYGSKLSIEVLKTLKNTKTTKGFIKGVSSVVKPLKNGLEIVGKSLKEVMESPITQKIKNSKIGNSIKKLIEKPSVKGFVEQVKGYKNATKEFIKSAKGEKLQNIFENTMGVSATTSVLIDDLAGRNDNKSNLELALGASGGDK